MNKKKTYDTLNKYFGKKRVKEKFSCNRIIYIIIAILKRKHLNHKYIQF